MRTHPRERKGLDVLKTFVSEGSHKRSGSQAGATVMLPVTPRAGAPSRHHRWGVVLAGGDGVRLRPLTRVVRR